MANNQHTSVKWGDCVPMDEIEKGQALIHAGI